MDNLHLKIDPLNSDTLTVRSGTAIPLKEPEKIVIKGDIKSVSNFLFIRRELGSGNQKIDPSKAVVLVDKKALTIELQVDPENYYGTKVLGTLEVSDELKEFYINQVYFFRKDALVNLIKFNRIYFADASKYASMLLSYQKMESTVNIKNNDSSDDRGNKERLFIKEVTTNAPTDFILEIPIYKGFPTTRFKVDVCLDVTEGSARFWFQSTELHEIMIGQVDFIFSEQLEAADGFVIINK